MDQHSKGQTDQTLVVYIPGNIKHTKRILGSGDGLTITMKKVHMRIIRQLNEQEKDRDWNHIQTLYKRMAPIREC